MGGEVQFAKNQPMEEQRIRQQMEKLGNTDFQWEDLNIEINGRIFVPVKVLNEVRRDALSQLRGSTDRMSEESTGYEAADEI